MAQDGKDSAGVVLAVGNTVNLTGTVASIDLGNPHYCDVVVTLTNVLTPAIFNGPPKGVEGSNPVPPGPVKTIAVHSSMLTKV